MNKSIFSAIFVENKQCKGSRILLISKKLFRFIVQLIDQKQKSKNYF